MKNLSLSLFFLTPLALMVGCSEPPEDETASEVPACFEETVSYSKDIVPILEANCYECHNEKDYNRKADGNRLDDYADLKEKIEEKELLPSIKGETGFIRMPYRREKLDSCSIVIIEQWVKDGAPEN